MRDRTNPFDDPDASFTVLSNAEGQHSLWPVSVPAPAGWSAVHGPSGREACLAYVEEHWTDLRPSSLGSPTSDPWAGAAVGAGAADGQDQAGGRPATTPLHGPKRARNAGDTLDGLICRYAETTPDAIAVTDPEGSLTYAELVERARGVAAVLCARGMETEARVGVLVPRSCDYVVAVLGVMLAGCAFVPLDPEYPPARLTQALRDSGAAGMICRKDTATLLPFDGETVRLDEIEAAEAPAPVRPTDPGPGPGGVADDARRLACVLYTSGSTGRPKGVALPHAALVNHFLWEAEFLRVGPADRIAQRAPSGFDAALWELAVALLSGATLVVVPTEVGTLTSAFRDYADARGISLMLAVPTLLQAYLESGVLGEVPSLRTVVSCGEALHRSLAESIRAETGARVVNVYGPTEGGVGATEFSLDTDVVSATVPIGKPAGNVTIHLLDDRLRPAPAGETGEVYIAGPQLARGYFGAPALTAERFVADHLGGVPGARLYRTGDLARMLPSGDLEYLGRGDGQFKLHGVRVETAEVEAVLTACPGVGAAAVAVRPVAAGRSVLVAYVVPLPEAEEGLVSRLHAFARDRLHGAMIPARCVLMDRLPLLPNGKVDRSSLPAVTDRPGKPARARS
ncbi:hypothetical protein GCM10022244_04870 [Streptomyces gulbargensis]|uniref:MbtH-like domain-containing protein n=1 Tax=Streptomyces gulbargensis TaxID=364901 RepID=A0ABP7LDF6_9ACTN